MAKSHSGGHRVGALHRIGTRPKHTMIIAFLGESINRYQQDFLSYLDAFELVCPYCSSLTHWHCWYKRSIKGEEEPLSILRVKCRGCKKTHAVLPDFLSPYKHYPQIVQEKVIEQALEGGVAPEHIETVSSLDTDTTLWSPSVDTMRRWIRKYRQYERQYVGAVASFLERHRKHIGVWRPGFAGFSHLLALTEQLTGRPLCGSCLFGKMNILLTVSQPRLWI